MGKQRNRVKTRRSRKCYERLPKEFRRLCAKADAVGWDIWKTPNGHIRIKPPSAEQPIITVGTTPSSSRSLPNFRADLKRSGLEV